MKKAYILTVLILIYKISLSQITFQRTYGGEKYDIGMSIITTEDDGYILICESDSYQEDKLSVIKTDKFGDTIWNKNYGGDKRCYLRGHVEQTFDNGYILTGQANTNSIWDIYIIKIDNSGNIIWEKTYGGDNYDCGTSVIQTKDSLYLITGRSYSFGDKTKSNSFLAKLDKSGDTLWLQAYYNDNNGSEGIKILEGLNNEYYLLSTINTKNTFENEQEINLMKVDLLGHYIWDTTFSGDYKGLTAEDMIFGNDSNIVILGQLGYGGNVTRPGLKIINTKLNGEMINSFESYQINSNSFGILPNQLLLSDNGYYIVGSTNDLEDEDGFIYLFNKEGNIIKYKYFGGTDADGFMGFCQTSDGGFALVGRTYSLFNSRDNYGDIYVVKTDSNLKTTIDVTYIKNKDTIICDGDSIYFGNSYIKNSGIYYDTIEMINGYDSVTVFNISFYDNDKLKIETNGKDCMGDTVELFINEYQNILWSDNSIENTVKVWNSGKYWAQVMDTNNCLKTDTVDIFFNPIPEIDLGPDTIIVPTEYFILSTDSKYSKYLWSTNSIDEYLIVSLTDIMLGEYYFWLQVTNEFGCQNSDTIKLSIIETTRIKKFLNNSNIKIYPNPFTDMIEVDIISKEYFDLVLQIADIKGNVVYHTKIINGFHKNTLNLENLSTGIYFLSLIKNNDIIRKVKVIKK